MRVSREEKDRSHARIVASASRLFRERGIAGTSVGDVMQDAGLTHGGFYRHFGSKDALVIAALEAAFDELMAPVLAAGASEPAIKVREDFCRFYLSDEHVKSPGIGCPAAALGVEIGRGRESVKAALGRGVEAIISALSQAPPGARPARQAQATGELAAMIGAVVLARASDPQTAKLVLEACRARLGLRTTIASE